MDFVPRQPIPESPPAGTRTPEVPLTRLDTLWLQVGGTLCNLACNHCFISCHPENHKIAMMTEAQVRSHLEDAAALGVRDYYITGGEVFLNPEIMEILAAILEYGDCFILTNGTTLTASRVDRLRALEDASGRRLHFRVSLDSLDEAENDAVRGAGSYRQAVRGLRELARGAFPVHLTLVRSWEESEDPAMERRVMDFLRGLGVPEPGAKFLPGFLLGELEKSARPYHQNERVTEQCFENWPITHLQCASSRMATAEGVWVCPILVEDPSARMGTRLQDSLRPYPLRHAACYTCRISGMSCAND